MFIQKKLIIPELDKVQLDEYISLKESQMVIFNVINYIRNNKKIVTATEKED